MPAARPALSPSTAPPSPEGLAASILALIVAIEGQPDGAPAVGAYRAALRRKGQDLAESGGPAGLADVLARVRASAADRADGREAILAAAWAGLPSWRS